jgi:hypothetical protein
MKQKSNKTSTRGPSARPLLPIAGLAACFAVSAVIPASFAQPTDRNRAAAVAEAVARRGAVQIDGLMVTYFPNRANIRLSDTGSSTYRRDSWMRILIQFSSQPEWADEVRFDCYVLMRDGTSDILLTGSVTCTFVKAGRRHLACVFVPPAVLERYGGNVRGVAVECNYQNDVASDYSIPRTTRKWWQDYTAVPNVMVSWFHTPFLRDGIESFELVKPAARGF